MSGPADPSVAGISFEVADSLASTISDGVVVASTLIDGVTMLPFITNGCPDKHGELACNRPYGSYRPGEEFRDYPFLPMADDLVHIRQQMRLKEVWHEGGTA